MEYKFIGNAESFKQIGDCIEIYPSEGKLRIHILADDLVRVRFTQNQTFENDFSYAVSKTDWSVNFNFQDNPAYYLITTKELNIKINKTPLRISFLDKDNSVISEDEPSFGISHSGTEVQVFKSLESSEKFFGLGEKAGNLDKRGKFLKMWNTDWPGYTQRQDPLYVSIPFFIGMRNMNPSENVTSDCINSNKAYGYFLDNTYETFFNLGASQDRYYSFGAKHGELNYYFFYGPDVEKVVERYTELTGRMELPPLWALGYQQCRWSYFPDKEVLRIAKTFREKNIPLDIIYLDIDWMDGYRVFQWSPEAFSDPRKLMADLAEIGVKVVTIIDPGIKADDSYSVAESGLDGGHFVKYPDGKVYKGEVWPGWSYFPDFTSPKTRQWWSGLFKEMVDIGVRGFWNDMNEPAVWGQAFPDFIHFNFDGIGKSHKAAHNVYGMQMARSTYEGAKNYLNGDRTLIVTRAGYAGVQRYSAVWTGDNVSEDYHYRLGAVMVQGLGLSGVSFAGPDIGGFEGSPSPELFARWIQLGVFTPFFRTHSVRNSKAQEPWTFGEDVESNTREMICLRYKLLPYIYTSVYHSFLTGKPVVKPLFWFNQDDEMVYQEAFQYQYYFGDYFIVVAAKVHQDFTRVYLPEGLWYEFDTDRKYSGKQAIIIDSTWTRLPVFVKAGAVITMRDAQNFADETKFESADLHFYPGNNSETDFYEDDGNTYKYLNGSFLLRKIIFTDNKDNIFIKIEHDSGSFASDIKEWKIIIHELKAINTLKVNDKSISEYSFEKNKLVFYIKEKKKINININL